jgi:hypothetical protein
MTNETIGVGVPTKVYLDLAYHLRKHGDMRSPDDIVALALRNWMAGGAKRPGRPGGSGDIPAGGGSGASAGRGYQWKELFLPEGTQLRMRYHGIWYYASVVHDRLIYAGESVSPRDWGLMVTGGVRNAWRDVWLRRTASECWTRASAWRASSIEYPFMPGSDRRRQARRSTD